MNDQPGKASENIIGLFLQETEKHTQELSRAILIWEENPSKLESIEPLMRAAHSLKGAARIIGLTAFSHLAHLLEDCFVAAQKGQWEAQADDFDLFLDVIDFLAAVAKLPAQNVSKWPGESGEQYAELEQALKKTQGIALGKSEEPAVARGPIEDKPQPSAKTTQQEEGLFSILKSQVLALGNCVQAGLEQLKRSPHNLNVLKKEANNALEAAVGANMIVNNALVGTALDALKNALENTQPNELESLKKALEDLLNSVDLAPSQPKEASPKPLEAPKTQDLRRNPNPPLKELDASPAQKHQGDLSNAKEKLHMPLNGNSSLAKEQYVRVSTTQLSRLMGLAAESLIQTRRLQPLKTSILQLKFLHHQLLETIESRRIAQSSKHTAQARFDDLNKLITQNSQKHREILQKQLGIFNDFARHSTHLSSKLYDEIVKSRMRPFGEGLQGMPRLVRDLSRSLKKSIGLQITGEDTPVDRDILEKLEAPLNHIIRNACDHGIEKPEDREAQGKLAKGTIKIHAHHSAGRLLVTISDDGHGIEKQSIRQKILDKQLLKSDMINTLSDQELFDFLFLPGFTTAQVVTAISGRGVGLDVVQNLMQEVGGTVQVRSEVGQGTTFTLQLPVTRSVIRALLVNIDGEPYAFPLSHINRAILVEEEDLFTLEQRTYFLQNKEPTFLLRAEKALGMPWSEPSNKRRNRRQRLSVVTLGQGGVDYGVIVEKFLGETELVVRPLDPRLGKVPGVSAVSINDEGIPVLILDVEDILKVIERLLIGKDSADGLNITQQLTSQIKHILVVDDSLTIRETERQILQAEGYRVSVALDGMDACNHLRSERFDLVITDIDMPRMNGFELIKTMKSEPSSKNIPIIILSYKDRKSDRIQGLELGANHYLTKSSFQDQTFVQTVHELVEKHNHG